MDIAEFYRSLLSQVFSDPLDFSVHFPRDPLEMLEQELMMGMNSMLSRNFITNMYVRRKPEGYPSDLMEEANFVRMLEPHDAIHKGDLYRIGRITMHIAERDAPDKCLAGILAVWFGRNKRVEIPPAALNMLKNPTYCVMLENGVLGVGYINMDQKNLNFYCVASYYPPGAPKAAAANHYPDSKSKIRRDLAEIARQTGTLYDIGIEAISNMAILMRNTAQIF